MSHSHAEATFEVLSFAPVDTGAEMVVTAMPTGVATMEKRLSGAVDGRATTLFSGGQNTETGAGTYVAVEAFEGTVDGRRGSFNFVHAASTHGADRYDEFFTVVPSSGTGELAMIGGSGGLAVDPDGTHRIWFDYSLG